MLTILKGKLLPFYIIICLIFVLIVALLYILYATYNIIYKSKHENHSYLMHTSNIICGVICRDNDNNV